VSRRLTRRGFLAVSGGALAGGAALTGALLERGAGGGRPPPLGPPHPGLPARQHAWDATLARDRDGNPRPPRFHRLLLFDVARAPGPADVRRLEGALRGLERRHAWGPGGLLFLVAWGPAYFERTLGVPSPVPRPRPLSSFEAPALDDYGCCVHLASDDEERLRRLDGALRGEGTLPGGERGVGDALRWRETRTGFVGVGLPAARQDVSGIPPGRPVPSGAPLFMGFRSGLRRNQAGEDEVTIGAGRLAGGTTMHVSRIRLRLDSWYGLLDERQRVARMYAPQVSPAQAARFTDDAPSQPEPLAEAAVRYGVVGHAQAAAQARRAGRPRLLRRDFDSTDGGEAGVHFVSLQRSVADFVATRLAMNAARAPYLNPGITQEVNNGINEWIEVVRRANFLIPRREERAYPLLPGRGPALA
jgi:hypothetical protein